MGGAGRFIDPYDMGDGDGQDIGPAASAVEDPATLESIRQRITDVDRQILALLAQRRRLARRTRGFKGNGVDELYDPAREAAVVRGAAERGAKLGLDPEEVRDLYWLIVAMCRRAQVDGA